MALPPATFSAALRAAGVGAGVIALAVSHGVSFAVNYIASGAYRTADPGRLLFAPYGRVMVLHVVILLGGFMVQALGSIIAPLRCS